MNNLKEMAHKALEKALGIKINRVKQDNKPLTADDLKAQLLKSCANDPYLAADWREKALKNEDNQIDPAGRSLEEVNKWVKENQGWYYEPKAMQIKIYQDDDKALMNQYNLKLGDKFRAIDGSNNIFTLEEFEYDKLIGFVPELPKDAGIGFVALTPKWQDYFVKI